jgi:capsular polysaccharide biosynthesis protein
MILIFILMKLRIAIGKVYVYQFMFVYVMNLFVFCLFVNNVVYLFLFIGLINSYLISKSTCSRSSQVAMNNEVYSPNLDLQDVKNMRDLSTAYSKIKSNHIFRTGCVSKASKDDVSNRCFYRNHHFIFAWHSILF